MSEHRCMAPGHPSWHGSARHGTAWHTAAVPGSLGFCPQLLLWGHARGQSRAQGVQAGAWWWAGCRGCRAVFVLGGGCMCAAVCLCARPLSEAALSPKAFGCSGGTFPALVVFSFFYSGCTCANKTLPGPKVLPGAQELRQLPPWGCPFPASTPAALGPGGACRHKPCSKAGFAVAVPKGRNS